MENSNLDLPDFGKLVFHQMGDQMKSPGKWFEFDGFLIVHQ
jgi:hypothetical protein